MHTKAHQESLSDRSQPMKQKRRSIIICQGAGGLSGWRLILKRGIDLLSALIVLPLLLPLWILIAIAIKLESKGPVIFQQTRIGFGGRPFKLYKFRSMYEGSDDDRIRRNLESLNEADGPVFKIRNDPRITRVGAFLRRTSLDETPQIVNILSGDMSLVGPRPPLPNEVKKYSSRDLGRLVVKPGLTCLWQIQGRSEIPFDEWVALDLEYIQTQSLWLDFKILIKTIPAVLRGSGAW